MGRQEDFRKRAEEFADETRNTPEERYQTRHDYLAGEEYGCEYTIDKVCDIVNHYCNRTGVHPSRRVDIIDHIRKAMKE